MNKEADDLNEDIRLAGEESLKDMKTISVEVPAPTKAELDSYFTEMLAGDSDQVLARIAMHFLQKRSAVEQQVRELANAAPMLSMVSHSKMNHEGRTVARVGSLDDDLEGNILSQVGDNMRLGADWLRETFRRGVESGVITASVLLEFLLASPLYDDRRRPILENGLTAFMRGDSVAAVHVLLPQVEAAMRSVAVLVSAPTFAKRRGGGYHARLLDEFLRDELVANALGEDVMTYFRALLSDQRGWNIRNDICHGLAPIGMMTQAIADRILHALLVLGCYHTSSDDEAKVPSADSERPG